ncbi:MAG: winged helix-turn-helix domain-containing protein [Candidatus Dormibacteraceae bacterium]
MARVEPTDATPLAADSLPSDSGPLLAGEDPTTRHASDARRWTAVYAELQALHTEVLARRGHGLAAPDDLARAGERLAFWRRRHWELRGIDFDPDRQTLSHGGRALGLTRREAQVLAVLLAEPGRHLSARELLGRAWPESDLSHEQLRTYVARLRAKMAELGMPARIATEVGRGYMLAFD